MMYPTQEELLVIDIPTHVSLNNAATFLLSSGIAMNQAFTADVNEFL